MKSKIRTDNRVALACAMLVACVFGASSAFAGEDVRSETVKFQDLNVDTPAGAEALYGRIHAAAKRVCSATGGWEQIATMPCVRKAEAQAVEKLNRPMLTAYYRGKTGSTAETLTAHR